MIKIQQRGEELQSNNIYKHHGLLSAGHILRQNPKLRRRMSIKLIRIF